MCLSLSLCRRRRVPSGGKLRAQGEAKLVGSLTSRSGGFTRRRLLLLLLLGAGRDRGEGGSLRLLLLMRRGGLSTRGSKGGKEERELGRRRREGTHEIYGVVESRGDGGQGLGHQEGCSAQCLHLQHDCGRGREEERVGGACVCGQLVGVSELDLGEKGQCPGKECSPGEVFAMRGRAR